MTTMHESLLSCSPSTLDALRSALIETMSRRSEELSKAVAAQDRLLECLIGEAGAEPPSDWEPATAAAPEDADESSEGEDDEEDATAALHRILSQPKWRG